MSGVCVIWRKDQRGSLVEPLESMSRGLMLASAETFEHASDAAAGAGIGVAKRFGTQQIYSNARVLVACDAELFNEEELAQLAGLNPALRSGADTAALLAALYERSGTDFAAKLRGAFSVVLFDRRQRKLFAAIDGFGIQRLVYYQDAHRLLVSSRIDALVQSGEVPVEVDPRAIANVLNYSANLGPLTVLQKVHRLLPGHLLIADGGDVRLQRFWDMSYGLGGERDERRLARELEATLEDSVRAHAKNDTFSEMGAFLSGGTDSSTVVGMLSRMKRGPVRAFSIGFQEQPFNELGYARIAAEKFSAEHYTYLVGPSDCFEALPEMVRYFDEPFGNSSSIPTYFCARLAAQRGIKVLLAGDGGDELFGGNERYLTDKVFEAYYALPGILRKCLIEPAVRGVPLRSKIVERARGYIRRANLTPIDRFLSFQFLSTHPPQEVFAPDFLARLDDYSFREIPARHYAQAPAQDHLDRLLYTDMKITLADNDLPKVTCMAELAGVQVRFPFLDRSVADFSGRIPAALKVKGTQKRYLFKRAFRELLPPEILAKKKHGFGIPVAPWLKSDPRLRELSRDTLFSKRASNRGYFQPTFIEDLFRKHEAETATYYGDTLWSVLMLELWHHRVVDQPARVTLCR